MQTVRTKRNGKQWAALLLALIFILAGIGTLFKAVAPITAGLLFVLFLVWLGVLAFLAIGRAWAVGQDLLALISSALVVVALLPLLVTPVLGSDWLDTRAERGDKQEKISKEIDALDHLREDIFDFRFQETPVLLRFYILIFIGAVLSVAASLLVPRPSQQLPRVGRWLETSSLVALGTLFTFALLMTSGIARPEFVMQNISVILLAALLLFSLVVYYRLGNPVLGLAQAPIPEAAPKPGRKPTGAQKEALRRRGQSARVQQSAPVDLPDFTEQSLAANRVDAQPEQPKATAQPDAPPGSPGSLEPAPQKKPEKKVVPKPQKTKAPMQPGWYPDPFSSGGQRYWDGNRWGQQTQN